jgi:hypothetical protein
VICDWPGNENRNSKIEIRKSGVVVEFRVSNFEFRFSLFAFRFSIFEFRPLGPADFIQELPQPRQGDLCLAEAEQVIEASEFPDA